MRVAQNVFLVLLWDVVSLGASYCGYVMVWRGVLRLILSCGEVEFDH